MNVKGNAFDEHTKRVDSDIDTGQSKYCGDHSHAASPPVVTP